MLKDYEVINFNSFNAKATGKPCLTMNVAVPYDSSETKKVGYEVVTVWLDPVKHAGIAIKENIGKQAIVAMTIGNKITSIDFK